MIFFTKRLQVSKKNSNFIEIRRLNASWGGISRLT